MSEKTEPITTTLSLDLAWIGEGPELQRWHPEESWCDGFIFRTPQDYADAVLEAANEAWRKMMAE